MYTPNTALVEEKCGRGYDQERGAENHGGARHHIRTKRPNCYQFTVYGAFCTIIFLMAYKIMILQNRLDYVEDAIRRMEANTRREEYNIEQNEVADAEELVVGDNLSIAPFTDDRSVSRVKRDMLLGEQPSLISNPSSKRKKKKKNRKKPKNPGRGRRKSQPIPMFHLAAAKPNPPGYEINYTDMFLHDWTQQIGQGVDTSEITRSGCVRVQTTGTYFIYSQVSFSTALQIEIGAGLYTVEANGGRSVFQALCKHLLPREQRSTDDLLTCSSQRLINLKAGDCLKIKLSPPRTSVYLKDTMTFFGGYLIR